jgi:hypothetical protein
MKYSLIFSYYERKYNLENANSFKRVWKIFTKPGVAERHFNGLQSKFRALASIEERLLDLRNIKTKL